MSINSDFMPKREKRQKKSPFTICVPVRKKQLKTTNHRQRSHEEGAYIATKTKGRRLVHRKAHGVRVVTFASFVQYRVAPRDRSPPKVARHSWGLISEYQSTPPEPVRHR